MKNNKKIIKRVIIVLIVLILLFNVYSFINTKLLKNDLTKINSYALVEVSSSSMSPDIKSGDLILVDTTIDNYKVGDIIAYKDNNQYNVSKIFTKNGNNYILKGDSTNTINSINKSSDIVGVYSFKISYIGGLLKTIRNPIALILILTFGSYVIYVLSMDIDDNEEASIIIKERKTKKKNKVKK